MAVTGKSGKVELKRELGLFSAISIILAVMIGSGIFVSPTSALERSGSVGLCLIVWATCGVLSLCGALAFAELSTVVPRSGAEYAYFIEAFSPLHRYGGQLPAFTCSWVYVMVLRPAEVAVVILTFAEYSVQPFASFMQHVTPESMGHVKKLIAIMALGLITYINLTSVKLYVKVQNVFVVCKVSACVLIIGGGAYWLASAVAVLWAERVLPPWLGVAIPLGVALSTFGCALSIQFGVSRLCYVAGREGHVPRVLSFVHVTKMTPAAAVVFQALLSLACIIVGDITALIEFASFLTWVFYGLAMVALIVMRRTKPNASRPYSVPIFIPWIVLFIAMFLAVMPIIAEPSPKYLFALIFIVCGVGVYHVYVYNKKDSALSKKLSYIVQVLCLVVAPEKDSDDD